MEREPRLLALRGAITLGADTKDEVSEKTQRLVKEMLARNDVNHDDLVSIIFTATDDGWRTAADLESNGVGIAAIEHYCFQGRNAVWGGATIGALVGVVVALIWPGFDLRPIKKGDSRVDYGLLPPNLFERLIEKFRELRAQGKVEGASRDEPMQGVPAKSSPGSRR